MKRSIVFGVAAVMLAACSSGGDASPTTVTTTTAPTAAVSTSTTTTLPATTSTTSTSTTTTLPATTTTVVSTEDLIKQAVQDYADAYHRCGAAPAECDPSAFTANQGNLRAFLTDLFGGMAAQGIYFSTDLRGSYLVAESMNLEDATLATAVYCAYDAGAILGPPGPDGEPTTVNNVTASVRYRFGLYLEDTTWRVGAQEQVERLGEGSLCPPAG